MTVAIQQLVDGAWVDGGGPLVESVNPARPDEMVAHGPGAMLQDVDRAVRGAVPAAESWRRTPMHERCAVLRRAAGLLDERADQYGEELTREEGKTLAEGIGEVRRAAAIFEFNAGEADRESGELYNSPRRGEQIMVVRRPLGVVGIITPWNFPIAIPAWKIAPALAHGNAVVWKPASIVPLLAYRLSQVLVEAGLPAGVLSLLVGPGAIGTALAEHPGTAGVSFTGSTGVGTSLLQTCAALRKPVQTEMGGKNAAVVLADADLELAAEQVVLGAMRSTGQKCTATSRVVVAREIEEEFLGRVAALVDAIVVGDGLEPGVTMGPASSGSAKAEIEAAVAAGLETGGRVVATSKSPQGQGGFFVPAVVMRVDTDRALWREEIFGPVLAVATATSDEHAFQLANDSEFGLSAAVFTSSLERSLAAVDALDVGVLHVNSESAGADPHVPFGGAKASGFGPKEQGRASREFYTHTTTVYLR